MPSATNPGAIRLIVPALAKYVSVARSSSAAIAEASGFEKEKIDEIVSALGEACVNAVQHVYRNEIGGTVQILHVCFRR